MASPWCQKYVRAILFFGVPHHGHEQELNQPPGLQHPWIVGIWMHSETPESLSGEMDGCPHPSLGGMREDKPRMNRGNTNTVIPHTK
jgi:hypothetical protein